MHGKDQIRSSVLQSITRAATTVLAIAIVFVLTLVATQSAQAQTYK